MSIILSGRLDALRVLAGKGEVAADVGCDHGYLSIALIESGAYHRGIACDLREGPLNAAKEHIRMAGLEDRIECRRADGLCGLAAGEAETLIIAGMGGALMMQILDEGSVVARSAELLVLQPQSELTEFRRWLREQDYEIVSEDMVCEDGKYYPMMAAVPTPGDGTKVSEIKGRTGETRDVQRLPAVRPEKSDDTCEKENVLSEELADAYGGMLLKKRHPVLKEYLENVRKQNAHLLECLTGQRRGMAEHDPEGKTARIDARILELQAEEKRIMEALWFYRN